MLSLKLCLLLCPLLLSTGKEGLYDNPAMKRTPQGAMKGKDGMEEDIYGGLGEGDGSIYDDTTGGRRGMKHSEEGIYDNPNAKGERTQLRTQCVWCISFRILQNLCKRRCDSSHVHP